MRLRIGTKLLLALATLFAALSAADYAVQHFVVMNEFNRLEESEARDDLRRCREAILRELQHQSVLTRDWSAWDDPYRYVVDHNQAFAESNLQEAMWKTTNIHLLYFIDTDGNVVWGQARDQDYETPVQLSEFPPDRFPPGHGLLAHDLPLEGDPAIAGIMLTERGPMLVCARPILTSESKGPAHGTLIMGRFLTPESMAALREQTRVRFDLYPVDAPRKPAPVTAALARLRDKDDLLVQPADARNMLAHAYLVDPQGRPAFLIEAMIPREISAQGAAAMRLAPISMALAAVLSCGLTFALLRVLVVGPLERFTAQATQIGKTGDLTRRIGLARADELGVLAREFDAMIQSLSAARAKLVETSRQAGMADVATSVLHNVGNVLNSVNISTTTLTDCVRKSKITGLARAAELLGRNRTHIAEFVTQDERGRNLPEYLTQLAQALLDEQHALLGELGHLKASVDHVNQVVQSQRTFARTVGHLEPVDLRELVRNALVVTEVAFKRRGITVQTDLAEIPSANLDAAKCLQILVNLLTNAKEALGTLAPGDKRLAVRLRRSGEHEATIEVVDSGVGIAPENLARIFSSGFTTKAGGRGFGLHYCALAAKEMGGELTAHSDGPGRGARFALRLALRVCEEVQPK
jgi:sensor domain CHASE-containing protein